MRVRVIIGGRVQGVGFRYFVQENAHKFQIKGYVKNVPGGSVEIDAEGESKFMDKFLQACRRGPIYAHIETFTIHDVPEYGYTRFRIRHCDDY
jgi:acylphosphatase